MERILILAIIYVLRVVFKAFFKEDKDDQNKTVKKIDTNLNELSYNYKKQKHIEEFKEGYADEGISDIFIEDIGDKQDLDYLDQEENLNKDYDKNIKSTDSDGGFDLFSNSDDLMKAIIMSEILDKPKSMRR